jgi:hypothetical protein
VQKLKRCSIQPIISQPNWSTNLITYIWHYNQGLITKISPVHSTVILVRPKMGESAQLSPKICGRFFFDLGEFRPISSQKFADLGKIRPNRKKNRLKIFVAKFNCADSPISNKFRPEKIILSTARPFRCLKGPAFDNHPILLSRFKKSSLPPRSLRLCYKYIFLWSGLLIMWTGSIFLNSPKLRSGTKWVFLYIPSTFVIFDIILSKIFFGCSFLE